ncbi:ferritin-like domain-containing protein [Desulfotruncus alcoholivorax]|uniref:ferritin-like domain-containing protein n=1 Tax=Desulfotruncus alcoholivorax TaxID=265477 RepID=UPI0003FCAE9C|nr:manganese catalase family protein [Desulfotruncus alcoholivorax]
MSNTTTKDRGCVTPALFKCAYQAPYPEVRVVKPSAYYAQLLLEDYAGQVSETTAITQYLYHHYVLEKEYKEIADLLSCIALVEMHHQEMLADVIIKLGADPQYRTIGPNNVETYWSASYITYGTALCDRISADIAGEWSAIANYRRHQSIIDDPYIKAVLERIILDEMHHITLFNQVLYQYCRPV